jgi:hypothetical protein
MLYLIIPLIMFFSCQNEARWYPKADVEAASHVEYTDYCNPVAGKFWRKLPRRRQEPLDLLLW